MTKQKSTKKTLLTSVLSLVLCMAMLIGTTFAWFTDSVTSANNRITAGNLDIELEYYTETGWKTVKDATELFTGNLWEPGHTEVVYFKLTNKGTLALKYQLGVNIVSETGSVNVEGDNFKLSQYIEYGVIEGKQPSYANRTEAVAAVEKDSVAIAGGYAKSGTMITKGEELYLAMVVYMPETVGNEANYATGAAVPTIDLGVNLLATQYTHENDSFNNQYDKNAVFGNFEEVGSTDDLMTILKNAEEGEPLYISLTGDATYVTNSHNGADDITPASSVVIDGQGKYTLTATGAGVTPIGDTEAIVTLKDLTVADDSVSYNESAWEFSYLELGGAGVVCENVTFTDPIQVEGKGATFTNCSFTGMTDEANSLTMYGAWVLSGAVTFDNCTFAGTRGLKVCDSNVANSYASANVNVVVDECTFNGLSQKPGVAIDYSGDDEFTFAVTIKNSTFINCQPGDQENYIYETDNVVPTLENNTVYTNAKIVSSADDLMALSATALTSNNNKAEEVTIILTADIDMNNADFSAIIAQRGDSLTIVGNGHTISNVNVVSGANDNTTGQASMFYAYPNSTLTVSDLILKDIVVKADADDAGYAAAVIGYCEGTAILNNVDVVNAEVVGAKSSGILAGHLSGVLTATNCDVSGSVTLTDYEEGGHYAGKYIGTLAGTATLTGCTADVTIGGNLKAANVGDIFGRNLGTLN